MTSTADTRLNEWLRDAHAMEQQAIKMLDAMVGRIENYPELKARIARHAEETRDHAVALEECLRRRGTDTSLIKDVAAKFVGMGQGLSGLVVSDEIIKGSMASYTFEHMEISAYRVLIAAAYAAGDKDTAETCEAILKEEIDMADWLDDNIQSTTARYLERESAGLTAKH